MVTTAESEACAIKQTVVEDMEGPMVTLPGCNPLSFGPENAGMNTQEQCPKVEIATGHAVGREE
jgi:hypothetical protein